MQIDISHIDTSRIPAHVAIIMDGNGRWAQSHGMERSAGHVEGVNTVRRITEIASEIGVKYLTLYTFSTENWNRPEEEVNLLMHLIVTAIERETPNLIRNNVRLTMIGDISRLPDFAAERLQRCFSDTSHCTGLNLILALSYSARWEITEAVKNIAKEVADGTLSIGDITDEIVSGHMTTAGKPDPDLLIRTGGDFRISNFLLWQLSYSEIIITNQYWPDFTKQDFVDCVALFQGRQRRFGLIAEQL